MAGGTVDQGADGRTQPADNDVSGELAIFYLGFLVLTYQVARRLDPVWGTAGFAVLIVGLVVGALRAARPGAWATGGPAASEQRGMRLRVALVLPPLIGLASFSLPLHRFDAWGGSLAVALPALVAAAAVIRAIGYRRSEIGLRWPRAWKHRLVNLVVVPTGIGVGYLDFRLSPAAPAAPAWLSPGGAVWVFLAAFGLGFTVEVVYRGILQRAATGAFGVRMGVSYVAALSVLPIVGDYPPLESGLALAVAVAAGAVAHGTRSIIGIGLAHGLAILFSWVVLPIVAGSGLAGP